MSVDLTTTESIEAEIIEILKANRPGTRVRGCNGVLETYAKAIHERLVVPLLAEAGRDGRALPIDDLGHETHFAKVWNRTIAGKPEPWDCRTLTQVLINGATEGCGGTIQDLMNDNLDPFDQAIVAKLPDILMGHGMPAVSAHGMTSWVDGLPIDVRLDGLQVHLERDGTPLEAPEEPLTYCDIDGVDKPLRFYAMMNFHGTGVDHGLSDRAFDAWRKAMDTHKLMNPRDWDSCQGLINRTIRSFNALGILWQHLRQDESVSIEAGPEGVTLYRGAVEGLEAIHDEGMLLSGPRACFVRMLTAGDFDKEEAEAYLDQLAETSSAFSTEVPAGAVMRVMLDPEILYAYDMPDDDMCHAESPEEALPILAWGTFPLPEMLSHRERARRAAETDALPTPE